jgi:hypothetical protein
VLALAVVARPIAVAVASSGTEDSKEGEDREADTKQLDEATAARKAAWMAEAAASRDRFEPLGPPATPEEIAEYIPPWAREFLLDEETRNEYEASMARERARELASKRVEGRTWEGEDAVFDYTAHGGLGDEGGFPHFTPEEIAEDYDVPLETVAASMLRVGIPKDKLRLSEPLKRFCTLEQSNELCAILGWLSADPIAAHEELTELTLRELSETGEVDVSPSTLVKLCRQCEIDALLGEDTRILTVDYDRLMREVDDYVAFRGPQGRELPQGREFPPGREEKN